MTNTAFDTLLTGGTVVSGRREIEADVAIRDGKIAAVGTGLSQNAAEVVEVRGLHVLPGVIDQQVHFREPGNEHKETIHYGTKGAILGGVTCVLEMPNTKPTTTTAEALAFKHSRVGGNAYCDIGFYIGASPENVTALPDLEKQPGVPGIKIFMGSSTGTLLVSDDQTLEKVLRSGTARAAIHAEDEDRLNERKAQIPDDATVHHHAVWRDTESAFKATKRIVGLSHKTGRRIHVLHITTADEIAYLKQHKGSLATVEVLPQHLTLSAPECYDRLGTKAQMNPPIRNKEHLEGLWAGIRDGVVDCMGSDHAPHTLEEKSQPFPKAPSGMPGVQTILPVMLNHVNEGRLSLTRMVQILCEGAARVWSIRDKGLIAPGMDADLAIVDLKRRQTITNAMMANKSGWTPFDEMQVTGWPVATWLRGKKVMADGEVLGSPQGQLPVFGA